MQNVQTCDGEIVITYSECMLRCLLVAVHLALLLPLCGWRPAELPACVAALPSPAALQVAPVPAPVPAPTSTVESCDDTWHTQT